MGHDRVSSATHRRSIVLRFPPGQSPSLPPPFLTLTSLVTDLTERLGYVGLAAVMVIENLFPPIPSEVVLPLAGYQVSRGGLTFALALGAATVGSLIGALALYGLGRSGGRTLILRFGPLLRISPAQLQRAEAWFARRGDWVVLLGRMVPGARSLVSVPAGLARMPIGRFCALTILGSLAWNALLIGIGQALGARWTRVGDVIGPLSTFIVIGLMLIGLGLLWRAVFRRRAAAGLT